MAIQEKPQGDVSNARLPPACRRGRSDLSEDRETALQTEAVFAEAPVLSNADNSTTAPNNALVPPQAVLGHFSAELWNEGTAASYLGLSRKTLRSWRVTGGPLPFSKLNGRVIRYKREHVIALVENGMRRSTSDKDVLR